MAEQQRQEGVFQERRAAKRKIAKFTMFYKIAGRPDAVTRTALTANVSSQSVLFDTDEPLPVGTKIEAEIVLPGFSRPLRFVGTIHRTQELRFRETGKAFHQQVVLFDEIAKEYQDILERYVQIIDIDTILRLGLKKGATDIHLVANQPPVFRIQGELIPMDATPIPPASLKKIITALMNERQRETFERELELDMSYMLPEGKRFRVNVHLEKGNEEAAFRVIPSQIQSIAELGLPKVVEDLARRKHGLVIVTGPAGSGKSTTLASMIDLINSERRAMIICIEDPIEYMHKPRESIVKQREVGVDTLSFAEALKHALRQDPNVIMVGEMRDLESISMAIAAAETGHLVLATLHTADTIECLNRIIDVYPAAQQAQIASQLSACLEGVISQILLPHKDGKRMVVATEVMVVTPAVSNIIRTRKLEQLYTFIESGAQFGMHTMDESLARLIRSGSIEPSQALGFAKNPARFAGGTVY